MVAAELDEERQLLQSIKKRKVGYYRPVCVWRRIYTRMCSWKKISQKTEKKRD